jgi:large subunit ribosomal protein L7/L12
MTTALDVDSAIKELGDKMVSLTVLQAKSLADYLESAYGIKPAAAGVVVAPTGGVGGGAAEALKQAEKTEFDVILTGFGENKIGVIKVVRAITSLGLKEAKDLVEGVPKPLKQGIPKDEADKIKKEIEGAGGVCDVK